MKTDQPLTNRPPPRPRPVPPVPLFRRWPMWVASHLLGVGLLPIVWVALVDYHRPSVALGLLCAQVVVLTPFFVQHVTYERQRRRAAAGRCVSCGYDLRASNAVRPECGPPIVTRP